MTAITVSTIIKAPINQVWDAWTNPEHITQWTFASDDWHSPTAENDLRIDGRFKTRMEAKDGSVGFDFEGTYTNVNGQETIEYTMDDGRRVSVKFIEDGEMTRVLETFDTESEHPEEMQRAGWQAILDNFKNYVENQSLENKNAG